MIFVEHGPRPEIPAYLRAPFRDIRRGVSAVAENTEEFLESAAPMLPDPARRVVRSTLDLVEHFEFSETLDAQVLVPARGFVQARNHSAKGAGACARCLGFAWDHTHRSQASLRHVMFSESIAASSIRGMPSPSSASSSDRSALIFLKVLKSGAIGRMPGLATETGDNVLNDASVLLASALVWLLAEPAATEAEERRLLDMSLSLTQAIWDDIPPNTDAPEALGGRFKDMARHL